MVKKTEIHNSDKVLHIVVFILICIGLLMVFSSSAIMAEKRFGDPFFFLKRQFMWVFLSFIALIIGRYFNYTNLQKFAGLLLIVSFVLIAIVLIPQIGVSVGGARRWFRFGFIGFQPSELAKIGMIVYTASWLDRKQSKLQKTFLVYVPKMVLIAVMVILIYLEPDLGAVILMLLIVASMHFVGGLKLKYLAAGMTAAIPLLYFAISTSAYRKRRLLSFLNPWKDPQGSGYQIIQSLLAIGSGGITGLGIGASRSKLLYLPDAHTDFIYPIIGEELGLIGSIGVILLFIVFFWRGIFISLYAKDFFGRMLAFGITIAIIYQAIINIAVATAVLPTKGMPLPFISFGGSSLIVTMFSVGILLNISTTCKNNGE